MAANRYAALIADIFARHHAGTSTFEFDREELTRAAEVRGMASVKNLGDAIDAFRYRSDLPESMLAAYSLRSP